jgi:tripartite-type tricarboxylate transporter receptor subunit TctC
MSRGFGNLAPCDRRKNGLNSEINLGLADPTIKARIADLGSTVFSSSPGAFARFIADETEKWGKVIRAANIEAQ